MNKILSALLVGFFAVSVNAFAADAAAPAEVKPDAAPAATMEKHTATPAVKHHHHHKKAAVKATEAAPAKAEVAAPEAPAAK